jgi:3-oxoacyl-[acyl-carrier protein] reductase
MDVDLTGNVALVTGAARGIGLVVAEDLASEGVNMHGVETLAVAADVRVENQVVEMVGQVFSKWGQIDILINNAGIRQIGPVYETAVGVWDDIHSANLRGQFLCTREVLKQGMLDRNEGVMIFVSSGSGKRGEKGSSAYCASKFGLCPA